LRKGEHGQALSREPQVPELPVRPGFGMPLPSAVPVDAGVLRSASPEMKVSRSMKSLHWTFFSEALESLRSPVVMSRSRCYFWKTGLGSAFFLGACSHCRIGEEAPKHLPPAASFLATLYAGGGSRSVQEGGEFPISTQPSGGTEGAAAGAEAAEADAFPWTIYGVVDRVLRSHPSTRRAWARSRVLAARYGQARSAFYPQVKLSAYATKSRNPNVAKGVVQAEPQTILYPQLELTYSLFHFGRDQAVEAVRAALEASQHQYSRELQTLVYRAQCAYCQLDSAREAVRAEEQNLADAGRTQESVGKRYQSGLANRQEELQARANYCQARYRLEQTRAGVEAARAELAALCGVPVSGVDIQPLPRENIDWDGMASVFDAWRERPVEEREDLKAAKEQLAAGEAALRAEEKNRLPELVAGWTGSLRKFHHMGGTHQQYSAFVALQWNIFDGFRNTWDVLEAVEARKIAEADWEEARLKASQEIWTAHHALQSVLKQRRAAEACREAAEKSFEATDLAYQNGLASFSDLIAAQKSLATARQQQVQSENGACVALATLGYASGGIVVGEGGAASGAAGAPEGGVKRVRSNTGGNLKKI